MRAALYDSTAKRLDETFVKNARQLVMTDEGGAEIDAETALLQTVAAIDEVLEKAGDNAQKIEFVTASCFWHSLVGIGAENVALTPVFGWADTRSAEFVKTLREKFDENEAHNRTGARFHPSYWTAKLLWLKNNQPEIFEKTQKWLSFADFLAVRFFGEAATSVSQASGTGIFDARQLIWDEELISFLKIAPEKLPRIADDAETFVLKGEYANRWQSLKNAKWF